MNAVGYIRLVVRVAALAAAAAALLGVLPWPEAPGYVAGVSPFVALCSAVATATFHLAWLAAVAAGGLCLIRPRWFCRWACPMGLLVETASGPRRILRRRRRKLQDTARAEAGASPCPAAGRPADQAATSLPRLRVGPWIFWGTLGGALLGYPLLLWLDPLVLLSASAGPHGWKTASAFALAAVGTILLVSLLAGAIWCSRVCPLGAMQDAMARLRSWVRRVGKTGSPVEAAPDRPAAGRPHVGRRTVLAGLVALVAGVMGGWAGRRLRGRSLAQAPLRPPGAVSEDRFTGVCIRCGACIRACPANILRSDRSPASPAGWLAPQVEFASDYCREDCTRCMDVCPSGALRAVSLPRKQEAKIGLARVDLTVCWLATGRECHSCIHACPYQAISSVWDNEAYASKPVVNAELCNGCGACQPVCPSAPQAIRVGRLETAREPS